MHSNRLLSRGSFVIRQTQRNPDRFAAILSLADHVELVRRKKDYDFIRLVKKYGMGYVDNSQKDPPPTILFQTKAKLQQALPSGVSYDPNGSAVFEFARSAQDRVVQWL